MKRQPDGFTLTELVIVVAILATVFLLSISVAGIFRQRMNGTRCMANLKQFGVGLHHYIADHGGRFPPSRLQHEPNPKTGVRQPKPMFWELMADYLPHISFFSNGPLFQQGSTPSMAGIWWCPGDVTRTSQNAPYSYGLVMAFGGNKAISSTWDGLPNPEYHPAYAYLAAIEKPASQLIFMLDFEKLSAGSTRTGAVDHTAWPMYAGATPLGPRVSDQLRVDFSRHGELANALFLDGSVRALKVEDLLQTGRRFLDPLE